MDAMRLLEIFFECSFSLYASVERKQENKYYNNLKIHNPGAQYG